MNTLTSAPLKGAGLKEGRDRRWVWVKRIAMALVIGIVFPAAVGSAYQVIATSVDKANFQAPGQMVEVGGFQMHLNCSGEGSPTVVLEPGGGSSSLVWYLIQPEVAKSTRVCAYDRAGMGWSDPGPGPRDGQHIALELHTLLNRADIPAPYVLAGWSYGGLFVRSYVDLYPEDVAGMVLLDASHTDIWSGTEQGQSRYQTDSTLYRGMLLLARFGLMRLLPIPFTAPPESLPAGQMPQWKATHSTTKYFDTTEAESRSILDTMAQVRRAAHLGSLPLIVVTAGENQGADGRWAAYQDELASSLSHNSTHILVEGAQHHDLIFDPEFSQASSSTILQLIETIRGDTAGAP